MTHTLARQTPRTRTTTKRLLPKSISENIALVNGISCRDVYSACGRLLFYLSGASANLLGQYRRRQNISNAGSKGWLTK